MSEPELDLEALEAIRAEVRKRLDARERWARMAPLREAMQQSLEATMSDLFPRFMAGPTAESRRSILAMEKSADEWPERVRAADAERERNLAQVRRRTEALRNWLEALS